MSKIILEISEEERIPLLNALKGANLCDKRYFWNLIKKLENETN